jgi:hypothetical protein
VFSPAEGLERPACLRYTAFRQFLFSRADRHFVEQQSALQLHSEQGWNMFVGIPARLKLKGEDERFGTGRFSLQADED